VYRFWTVFFALVPILGTALCVYSFYNQDLLWFGESGGWWLPEDISAYGYKIDDIFNMLGWIVMATFLGCNLLLAIFMWKYADKPGEDRQAVYSHGSHGLEVFWTSATTLLLTFIALSQLNIWMEIKFPNRSENIPVHCNVTARQFEWRMTYPGPDGQFGTHDDFESNSDLVIPVGRKIRIDLRSADVLHSFFLPNMRIKQDAVPGLTIRVWFEAKKTGSYDLVCAELCGWGHYKMKGRLTVLSKDAYQSWLQKAQAGSIVHAEEEE
jgi:cytochrome c oxidase subunit II